MYQIVIFHRGENRAKAHNYETLDLAIKAASDVFNATGIVLGIEEVA